MPKSQVQSKYRPVWNALKATGICRITAEPTKHKTIIKGVKHLRDRDLVYRYNLAERHRTHELKITATGSILTFRLHEYLTLKGL